MRIVTTCDEHGLTDEQLLSLRERSLPMFLEYLIVGSLLPLDC